MRKIGVFLFSILSLLLVSCSELPPEPGNPIVPVGRAGGYYEGYGVPYDVYDKNQQIMFLSENVFNLDPDQKDINLGVSVIHDGGFVYKYGYYYTNGGWLLFEFPQQVVSSSNWIRGEAKTYLNIGKTEITPGENYIVAYSCKKYDGAWRCGCTYQGGPCNQWMIQTFLYRNVELPPEPVPPGSIIDTVIYALPNGQLVKQNENVNLYLSFQSTKDVLENVDNVYMLVSKPDGTQENVQLEKFGDVSCKECNDNDCYRQFSCYASFGGTYTTSSIGEYILDFAWSGSTSNNIRVETGKFKVVEASFFSEGLIENNIGSATYQYSNGWYDSDGYTLNSGYSNGESGIYSYVYSDYSWLDYDEKNYANNELYEKKEINGNIVYVYTNTFQSDYSKEVYNQITTIWFAKGKRITVDIYGINTIGYDEVVAAYMERYPNKPSTPTGEKFLIESSNNHLELSEDLTAGINRETLRNITTYIDKSNLRALSSGSVTNNRVTSTYNQYLYLLGRGTENGLDTGYVRYTENDNDVTADFLYFKSGREIGRYLLEFTTPFESGIYDSFGNPSSTGYNLNDFEDVDITMFAKKYKIRIAKRALESPNSAILILIGDSFQDTLLEKQTKSYVFNGKDYEVTPNFVDSDEAQFIVNGQTTRKLKDGDTDKLADGTTIGVTNILYQDYAGGIHSATFFLGIDKIELKDTNVTDVDSTSTLKADDNDIDEAHVIIEGYYNDLIFKMNRIHINMTADDGFFVPAGGKLSDTIKAEGGTSAEPQALFTQNWDFKYDGLSNTAVQNIKILSNGLNKYVLEFVDGDGNKVNVPIAGSAGNSSLFFGELPAREFINVENRIISKDDYLIVTDSSRLRGDRKTYALQYKGADKVTADNPVLKFRNLGSGNIIEQVYTDSSPLATLKIGGTDFRVYNASSILSNDFDIRVDLDGGGFLETSGDYIPITTSYGAEIHLKNETSNKIDFIIKTPDDGRDENAKDSVETLQATDITGYITSVESILHITYTGNLNLRTPDGKTNIAYGYTSYGSFITYETPTANPEAMEIIYPQLQRVPLVYIVAGKTS
ncbi:hypothetical protein HYX05_02905 [Candidatus Woesearchaeota archaeon]|nr:hypothetical protein [Candidatus Aenigmarchaeota archaeon]MBI2659024.1 hypothetical protein [Candidatus Woesearchaeota archaeon]